MKKTKEKKADKNKATDAAAQQSESTAKSEAKNDTQVENEIANELLAMKAELEESKTALTSAKDQYLRLYAEFENFKRRNAKERLEFMATANQEVMHAMLPILDDFERALKNMDATEADDTTKEGVKLIYNKLMETLKQKGLKSMDSSIGKEFDVEKMEAITRLPVPDKTQHNQVIDEIERGYMLGDKVLRYARVVVAQNEG